MIRRFRTALPIAAVALTAACDDPYNIDWSFAEPDTVTLYSLSRAEYVRFPSVYDFVTGYAGAIEDDGMIGFWDLGFVETDGDADFLLPGGWAGLRPQAVMRPIPGYAWEDVVQAPTAGYDSASVRLHTGLVYVLRTRSYDSGGATCYHYAKVEPVELDVDRGILRFRYMVNPNCGSRRLVPT